MRLVSEVFANLLVIGLLFGAASSSAYAIAVIGLAAFLGFLAIVSVSLGVLNLLPILPLHILWINLVTTVALAITLDVGEFAGDPLATSSVEAYEEGLKSQQAHAEFTGDSLLIGGCGRMDYGSGDVGEMYDSITGKLFTLPDETLVYPAHDYQGRTSSSIIEEKHFNPRLLVNSRDEYIEQMNALQLEPPAKIDIAVPANIRRDQKQAA